MVFGTGQINIPLGGAYARHRSAALPTRNVLFLQGPLFTQHQQLFLPKIQIDFPLDSEYDFEIVPQHPLIGITVGELVDRVIDIYEHVYNQPSTSSCRSSKIRAFGNNHCRSNNTSSSTSSDYGIYAHDLDELVLVEAEYSPTDNTIYLIVEARKWQIKSYTDSGEI